MSQLTSESIAVTALSIIDQEGLEALSMRRLGRELNVDAKAVYYYYANKDALIDGMMHLAFQEMRLPSQLNGGWQQQLRELATAYYQLVYTHPALVRYLTQVDGSIPRVFEIVERVVIALKDTGLSGRQIVQIVDLFVGFAPSFAQSATVDKGTLEQIYHQISELPDDRFPVTKHFVQTMTPEDLVEDFGLQVEIVLAGIQHLIVQNRKGTGRPLSDAPVPSPGDD